MQVRSLPGSIFFKEIISFGSYRQFIYRIVGGKFKFFNFFKSSIGWRLGLQALTVLSFFLFILGTFYRSASLYHPQRRAILHLKSQKRKIKNKDKEKNKIQDDRPPFFDFATLKSKTVRILLCSIGISSFGLNMPLFNAVRLFTLNSYYLYFDCRSSKLQAKKLKDRSHKTINS